MDATKRQLHRLERAAEMLDNAMMDGRPLQIHELFAIADRTLALTSQIVLLDKALSEQEDAEAEDEPSEDGA